MMFSTRRAVVCVLVIAGVAVCGHAQSTSVQEQTASISGKVTVAGEGVKGVVIALRTKESPSYGQLTSHRGVTDDKGQYRITNVPAGNYLVTPTATMFVADDDTNGERALMVDKGQTIEDFDFSLVRGGVITGRVLDSEGQPLIEEDVYLFSPRDPRLGSFRPAAVTDDRGVYRAFGLKPGNYTVAAGRNDIMGPTGHREHGPAYVRTFYPGVTDQAQAATIKVSDGSETTNIDITLGRPLTPHSASGRVVDSQTGQPVPDANYGVIQFVSGTQRMSVNRGSLTNSRGEFKLENLTPGQYAVTVQPRDGGDWRAEELRFEIADQDVTGLVVRTVKGGSVSGVVVLDGTYDNSIREQLANARLVVFVTRPGGGCPPVLRGWRGNLCLCRAADTAGYPAPVAAPSSRLPARCGPRPRIARKSARAGLFVRNLVFYTERRAVT